MKPTAKKGRPRKKTEDRRVRLTVRIHPDTRKQLEAWSCSSGDSMGQIIDAIVDGRAI